MRLLLRSALLTTASCFERISGDPVQSPDSQATAAAGGSCRRDIAATLTHSLVDFFILYISAETAEQEEVGGALAPTPLLPHSVSPPPVQSGLQPLQLALLFTGQSADSTPPPLFSIPYMPLLLNEQSRLTPSAERKPVRTQEGKESAAWKEGPENRGRQERGEKEEEWQDREGGGTHGERLLYS